MTARVEGRLYLTIESVQARIQDLEAQNVALGPSDGRVTTINALNEEIYTLSFPSDGKMIGVFDTTWEAEDHYWKGARFMPVELPEVLTLKRAWERKAQMELAPSERVEVFGTETLTDEEFNDLIKIAGENTL